MSNTILFYCTSRQYFMTSITVTSQSNIWEYMCFTRASRENLAVSSVFGDSIVSSASLIFRETIDLIRAAPSIPSWRHKKRFVTEFRYNIQRKGELIKYIWSSSLQTNFAAKKILGSFLSICDFSELPSITTSPRCNNAAWKKFLKHRPLSTIQKRIEQSVFDVNLNTYGIH